ncbi:3049_t:CDS:2 [Entrophospora sp. SA101]|nr:3049_t:CDS:2 [Entrophospora sp. SA101]
MTAWADKIKYLARYRFTSRMHYVEALKFLVHFIGDLHQPLHLKFEGHRTNLHAVWDTRIIYKRIRELHSDSLSLFIKTWEEPDDPFDEEYHNTNLKLFTTEFYDPYVDHIIKLMKTDWKNEVKNWVICKNDTKLNYSDANSVVNFNLDENKLKYWAISLESLNCKFIWKDFDQEMDLSDGEYYKTIDELNIIEKLLAIAGVRMAAILNTLFM